MTTEGRDSIIVGNWKMYKDSREATTFVQGLAPLVKDATDMIALAVSFVSLESVVKAAQGSSIVIGAQNMHDAVDGAFTGEISASMLKSAGAQFVILGHSERRYVFGESDSFINKKVLRALQQGIRPLFCLGESLEQRQNELTHQVLARQLDLGFAGVSSEQAAPTMVAYEPIWAIGTGQTATPAMAQQAHQFIRGHLATMWGQSVADKVMILYGGSVTPANATALMAESDIDGLLVGRAALEIESFSKIIHHHSLVSGS